MARFTTLLFAMWLGVTVSTEVDLEKRIFGGQTCLPTERLYHVKLIYTDDNEFFCGGSLISPQWILTAAHCVEPGEDVSVVIGVHAGRHIVVPITDPPVIFNDNDGKHDLMLLKLPTTETVTQPVQGPDCLHSPNISDTVQVAGHGATAAGPNDEKLDDTSDTLQCADMNIINCRKPFLQLEHRICYRAHRVDTCVGDSGGGVVYQNRIYGVHVRSGRDYVCSRAAKAMDLCHKPYFDWINKIINPKGANAAFGLW